MYVCICVCVFVGVCMCVQLYFSMYFTEEVRKRPARPSGPPARPMSMPPVKPPLSTVTVPPVIAETSKSVQMFLKNQLGMHIYLC